MGEDKNMCKKIPKSTFTKVLLHGGMKSLIILFYIAYIGVSVWGVSKMDIGFSLPWVVEENPMESKYQTEEIKLFNDGGPAIMFVINKPIAYENRNVQRKIKKILAKSKWNPFIVPDRKVSWLEDYVDFIENSTSVYTDKDDFYTVLRRDFLPKHPQYVNDVKFDDLNIRIISSRFYVFTKNINSSEDESSLLLSMKESLYNSSLPMTVYSPGFLFYEHHVTILKETILTVTVAIISMLLVALVFIPNPISVMCVIISMASTVLGFLGFLKFWNLSLSAIKTIQLLIAVGLCLNFTVHISHSFMTATGKSRNERVSMALEKVGGIILNEAVSLFLGISLLGFGSSYLVTSFFKCMIDVIGLGLLHSVILLPVLLTFIGPRRTFQPRVFIGISPSCRTMNEMFMSHKRKSVSVERTLPPKPDIKNEPIVPSTSKCEKSSCNDARKIDREEQFPPDFTVSHASNPHHNVISRAKRDFLNNPIPGTSEMSKTLTTIPEQPCASTSTSDHSPLASPT